MGESARGPGPTLALYAGAVGVGLCAGLLAVAFESALDLASRVRVSLEGSGPFFRGIPFSMLCSSLFAGVAVWLARRLDPDTAGSGIPQVEAALHRGREIHWLRTLWVKFTGGVLAIAGGLTLGREGPTVQMGASAGRALAGRTGLASERGRVLVAAGAGAGLAAAFHAPIAGTIFVLEELKVLRSVRHALAALIAAVTAEGVCRLLAPGPPLLQTVGVVLPPVSALPFYLAVGAAAGVLAAVFNRGLLATLALFGRLAGNSVRRGVGLGLAVGAICGFVGGFEPGWLGSGESLVAHSLQVPPAAAAATVVFATRFALTLASYASGAAGGLFAPLLVLGCEAGFLLRHGAASLVPSASFDPASAAIVSMGALFAGSVQAPLTGVVLMLEMTGALELVWPLIVAALVARVVARALKTRPIYEELLARLLGSR